MQPYREQVDKVVNKLLLYDKKARKADLRYHCELAKLQSKINGICGLPTPIRKMEHVNHYRIDPKNITLIEEIEQDYKRRQGNLVLGAVKRIKPEIFTTKIKHKVNDKTLKRRLAISHRKVGKLFDDFLASFGGDSELLERDFTNRLQEIEEEMQEEREQQEQANIQSSSTGDKWNWGK